MPEGIYSAAAGMSAQQAQMDVLANDIANVNTTGYKQQRLGFRDLVYFAEQGQPVGAGSATIDLGRTQAEGSLTQTGDPLSVAIVGPGYIQVRRADGSVGLTRDGQLGLDAQGAIVTRAASGSQPPLTVPKGTDAVEDRDRPPTAPSPRAARRSARSRSSTCPRPAASPRSATTSSLPPPRAAPPPPSAARPSSRARSRARTSISPPRWWR